jgi:PRTRC genetic system protein B
MSNLDTVHQANIYKPIKAIVFYQNESNEYYAEESKIVGNELRAGKSIKKSSFMAMGKSIMDDGKSQQLKRELFCDKVLYAENNLESSLIVWKWTDRTAYLRFTNGLGIKDGVYPLPNLVFVLKDNKSLYVYATKTSNINEETPLFRSPFFNILSGEKVCLGTSRLAKEDVSSVNRSIDTFERLFFESHFSALHEGGGVKENIVSLYKSLLNKKAFPVKNLLKVQQYNNVSLVNILREI